MAAETAQTLDRGLKVLSLLADSNDGMSVSDLARALDVSRTIVYRLTVTLEVHALVRRGLDGKYRLGLGVLAIARQVQPLLRDAALPALRSLAEELGATAYLSVVDSGDALVVAVVEPARSDLHIGCRVGSRSPLDRTAAGRAVLAARAAEKAGRGAHSSSFVSMQVAPGSAAHGLAAAVKGVPGIEAAVGVLLLVEPDVEDIGAAVLRAATDVAAGLH